MLFKSQLTLNYGSHKASSSCLNQISTGLHPSFFPVEGGKMRSLGSKRVMIFEDGAAGPGYSRDVARAVYSCSTRN
jgi:hypothetical protein